VLSLCEPVILINSLAQRIAYLTTEGASELLVINYVSSLTQTATFGLPAYKIDSDSPFADEILKTSLNIFRIDVM